jgi:hypothetical protein
MLLQARPSFRRYEHYNPGRFLSHLLARLWREADNGNALDNLPLLGVATWFSPGTLSPWNETDLYALSEAMALASRLLCHANMRDVPWGYSYRFPPPFPMWLLWYSVSELARHSVQCHVGEVCRLFKVHGSQREADSPCRQVRRLARISRRLCRLWRVLVPLARRLLCGACLASVRSSSCCRLPISLAVALPLPLGTCSCVRPSGIVCVRGSVRGGAMGRSDQEARVLAMRA